jgi:hypothetical protein
MCPVIALYIQSKAFHLNSISLSPPLPLSLSLHAPYDHNRLWRMNRETLEGVVLMLLSKDRMGGMKSLLSE